MEYLTSIMNIHTKHLKKEIPTLLANEEIIVISQFIKINLKY